MQLPKKKNYVILICEIILDLFHLTNNFYLYSISWEGIFTHCQDALGVSSGKMIIMKSTKMKWEHLQKNISFLITLNSIKNKNLIPTTTVIAAKNPLLKSIKLNMNPIRIFAPIIKISQSTLNSYNIDLSTVVASHIIKASILSASAFLAFTNYLSN